jgi:hypothetical protein
MNSNETVGRPFASISAMRIARSLAQDARVADPARDLDGVEVFE